MDTRLGLEWARSIAIDTVLTGNRRLFVSGYEKSPITVRTCYRTSGDPFELTDGDEYVQYLGYRFDRCGRLWTRRKRGSRAPSGPTCVGWDKMDDFDPGRVACFHYGNAHRLWKGFHAGNRTRRKGT